MHIYIVSVGTKMPAWVSDGYKDYAQRIPRVYALKLVEVDPVRRTRSTPRAKALEQEGKRLLAAIPSAAYVIALVESGTGLSSVEFAHRLGAWQSAAKDIVFLIGGADGLSADCLQRADEQWSLSALTFPHALVRVILIEQIYRAWSLLNRHPYHRA